jgi:methionyl aminopeptidase
MNIIIKNKEQINGIRKSCKLAAETLNYLSDHIIPGISTEELDVLAAEFIKKNNAIAAPLNYNGFPKSICTSINEVVCHGIPCENDVLKNGDIINIDVTTILNGYYGDTSKTFAVGKVSKEAKDLIDVTEECLKIGIDQVYPNNYLGNIGYHIATFAKSKGYSVVYQFVGHGTGLKFHEDPNVFHDAPKNSGPKLIPGTIFTIEPMISIGLPEVLISESDGWTATTIDKKLSAQFEHTVLVTEKKHEILTK